MELRDYVKIIFKNIWILIVIVFFTTIGAYILTRRAPQSYDGSVSVYITKKSEVTKTGEYQFDQYYSLQASSLLSDTIASWLKEPSNVIEIYNSANLDLPTEKMSKLAKAIDTTKLQPSTISINISGSSESTVRNLISSTINFLKTRIECDYDSSLNDNFEVNYSNPAVLEHQKETLLNTVLGLIAGIIIGLALIFLIEYFNPKKVISSK